MNAHERRVGRRARQRSSALYLASIRKRAVGQLLIDGREVGLYVTSLSFCRGQVAPEPTSGIGDICCVSGG